MSLEKANKSKKGYILVEVFVAISLLIVGLMGVMELTSRSVSTNRIVSDRFVATYLSAEGVEIIKGIIGNNIQSGNLWNASGLGAPGCYRVDYNTATLAGRPNLGYPNGRSNDRLLLNGGIYAYVRGPQQPFSRTVCVNPDPNKIYVQSIVEWTQRGGSRSQIVTEDYFFRP